MDLFLVEPTVKRKAWASFLGLAKWHDLATLAV
jgi:hypothetical protein